MTEKRQLTPYIPHRPPFVMVDTLVRITDEGFETEFFIEESNILVRDGLLQEAGLIENIAQSCAAGFGFRDRTESAMPKLGYIGAVTRVIVYDFPHVNTLISTTIAILHQWGNVILVRGVSTQNETTLLECEMKIVIAE